MSESVIDIRDLTVTRGGRTICRIDRLEVAAGQRVALLGPNGSGKSTLLRILAGLDNQWEGRCIVQASMRQRTYVHQSPYLFRGTVLANVSYGLRARGVGRRTAVRIARQWLDRLEAGTLAGRRVVGLSGGEIRRVALARALAIQPQLLLLDEPLAELDRAGVEAVCRVLCQLPGTTILIASPSPLPDGLTQRSHVLGA